MHILNKTLFDIKVKRFMLMLVILMVVITGLPMTASAATFFDEINVAVVQFQSTWGNRAANIAEMEKIIIEAAADGVDMILFPELCTTGFRSYNNMHVTESETMPGPTSKRFEALAIEFNMYIIYGDTETIPGIRQAYIVAVVVGPEGFVGTYRKIHPVEGNWCRSGTEPGMFMTPWGPIGISICYDTYYTPELARFYAASGCRLILNPTATSRGFRNENREFWEWYYKNRLESLVDREGVFVLSANLVGHDRDTTNFPGGSVIIGPNDFGDLPKYYAGAIEWDTPGWESVTINLSLATNSIFESDKWRPDLYVKWYSEMAAGRPSMPEIPDDAPNLRIGTVNFKATCGDKASNLASMKNYIAEADRQGVNLLVFPEMALSGGGGGCQYHIGTDVMWKILAETVPGSSSVELSKLAQQYNMYIVFGLPELDKNDYTSVYNASVILSPDGKIESYRKMHLDKDELLWSVPGKYPTMFNSIWGPIGVSMGYETYEIPELTRYYAAMGSRIIVNPSAATREENWEWFHKNRLESAADRDRVIIVSSNLVGLDGAINFHGGSVVVARNRNYLGTATGAAPTNTIKLNQEGLVVSNAIRRTTLEGWGLRISRFNPRVFERNYAGLAAGTPPVFLRPEIEVSYNNTAMYFQMHNTFTAYSSSVGQKSYSMMIFNPTTTLRIPLQKRNL